MEFIPELRKSQTTTTNKKNLNRGIFKNSAIYFRKNTNYENENHRSLVIFNTLHNKISINLKNDLEFLKDDKIEDKLQNFKDQLCNLKKEEMMNSTLKDFMKDSELNFKLHYNGLKIEESFIENNLEIQNDSLLFKQKDFSSTSNENTSNKIEDEDSSEIKEKKISEDVEYMNSDVDDESNFKIKNKFKSKSARDINVNKNYPNYFEKYSENSEFKNLTESEFKIEIDNDKIQNFLNKKKTRIIIKNKLETEALQKQNENCFIFDKSNENKKSSSEFRFPLDSPYASNENTKSQINQPNNIDCIICEASIEGRNLIKISTSCLHKICFSCGKIFYEDKIESKEFPLNCPVFKCLTKFSNDEILKQLVSTTHYDNYKNLENSNINSLGDWSTLNNRNENKMLALLSSNPNSEISIPKFELNRFKNIQETLKSFSKPHVINISKNDSLFTYAKMKEIFCKNCNELSLFGKLTTNRIKCMNCFKKFCKFCLSEATADHFDLSNEVYCKIYRKRINGKRIGMKSNKTQPRIIRRICEVFILNLLSLCLFIGYLNHIVTVYLLKFFFFITCERIPIKKSLKSGNYYSADSNSHLNKRPRKFFIYFKRICDYFYFLTKIITRLLILMIILPFGIMIIPYFQLINEIIR